nr:hypothetical protein [uncultured Duganella sp.]
MKASLKDRVIGAIKNSRRDVFLREDFLKLGGTYRQLSRALSDLQSEQVVLRAGYGLYIRPGVQDVKKGIEQVQRRLGPRVRREVTIGGTTVKLGMPSNTGNKQDHQDNRKLAMAKLIVKKFTMHEIRQRSLENIERWQKKGVWVSAFDEWRQLLIAGADHQLLTAMTGRDAYSNRLRQSAPYAGLLTQAEVEAV